LQVHGVTIDRNNLQKQLFQEINTPATETLSTYVATEDFGERGRPMLFVDDSYQMEQVYFWSGKLWCHECRKGGRNPCRHVRHAKEVAESSCWSNILKRLEVEGAEKVVHDCELNAARAMARKAAVEDDFMQDYIVSRAAVKFSGASYARETEKRAMGLQRWLDKVFQYDRLRQRHQVYPEQVFCEYCKEPLSMQQTSGQSLYCGHILIPVDVYYGQCEKQCKRSLNKKISFKGDILHLANYGNRILMPLELCEEYLRLYAASALTVSAWWDDKANSYLRGVMQRQLGLSLQQVISRRGQISTAMAGIAELVDLASAFKCKCECLTTISMDGIVLSTMRIAMPKFTKPWQMEGNERSRSSYRHERQLPPLEQVERVVLAALCKKQDGSPPVNVKEVARSTLNYGLKLLLLLATYKSNEKGNCYISSGMKTIANFLQATVAPVTSLVPYDYWEDVEGVLGVSGEQVNKHMRELAVNAPHVHKLCIEITKITTDRQHRLWQAYSQFVQQMLECKCRVFAADEDGLYEDLDADQQRQIYEEMPRKHPTSRGLTELWSTGYYFPKFPIVRRVKEVLLNRNERVQCHKEAAMDAGCMPGVLLFYCVEHQCCIGFVVLEGGESPRIVHEVLLTRFKTLPQNVIYDNGCNLSEYIINRTPYLFRRTQVFVDAFHYYSHSNCARCFSTNESPMLSEHWNTSLFEQRNARLTKLKETAPLMRARVFMAMLRIAVAKGNMTYMRKEKEREKKKEKYN
jgi:CxC4 like cysteine cluster associated with KDZ transposases